MNRHLIAIVIMSLSVGALAIPKGKCPKKFGVELERFGYVEPGLSRGPWEGGAEADSDEERKTPPDEALILQVLKVTLTYERQTDAGVCYYHRDISTAMQAKPAIYSLKSRTAKRVLPVEEKWEKEALSGYLRGDEKNATLTLILPAIKDEPETVFSEKGYKSLYQIDVAEKAAQPVIAYSYRTENRVVGAYQRTGYHVLKVTVAP